MSSINNQLLSPFNPDREGQILAFLHENYGFEVFSPGLERSRPLYLPFIAAFKKHNTKIITIAGTNGKGQTAHTLCSLFSQTNKRIGLWTSPHILSIRERFTFSEEERVFTIDYAELEQCIHESHVFLKKTYPELKISFYEFLFFVFLRKSAEIVNLDYLLLEVGLGGKLDAVNHFDADCSCITSISRDHQSILGNSYRQILAEKIAVSRAHKPLFTQFNLHYLNELTREYTTANQVHWFSLEGKKQGDYFSENQFLAWTIFRYFEPKAGNDFSTAMKDIPSFKGRREIMTFGAKSLIFIGAHNIDGIRRMLEGEGVTRNFPIESVLTSFSKRPVDEVEVMLKCMVEFFGNKVPVNVTCFEHPKALGRKEIESTIFKVNKGMLNFVADWKTELQNNKARSILICGSYYFIGEVQRYVLADYTYTPSC